VNVFGNRTFKEVIKVKGHHSNMTSALTKRGNQGTQRKLEMYMHKRNECAGNIMYSCMKMEK
jgi:hypothetical protein